MKLQNKLFVLEIRKKWKEALKEVQQRVILLQKGALGNDDKLTSDGRDNESKDNAGDGDAPKGKSEAKEGESKDGADNGESKADDQTNLKSGTGRTNKNITHSAALFTIGLGRLQV